MYDKYPIFDGIQEFLSKHFLVVMLSSILSILKTYVKRKENSTWWEKLLEYFFSAFFGISLSLILIEYTNESNKTYIVAFTVIVTLGADIIATWVMNSLKEVLDAVKRYIIRILDNKQ